eukprot:scaffold16179_cov20-Prasinocladus_malaysianus.AAC.1
MAGQISLDPPSLAIVPGGLGEEAAQALRNCEAAAVALKTTIKRVSGTNEVSFGQSGQTAILQQHLLEFYSSYIVLPRCLPNK